MLNNTSDLKILEELIVKYKQETDQKKKHVFYLNLIGESLKLVKKIASRIPVSGAFSRDDLIQVGAVGVLKAINAYKTEDKGSFKTYASIFIKGKILQFLRDKANIVKPPRDIQEEEFSNIKNIVSLDQNIFSDDGQETLIDRIQDNDYEEIFENKKTIEFALNKLPKTEKTIIYQYYIEGITKKEIANKNNISATQVARIIKRALNNMYNIIQNDSKET